MSPACPTSPALQTPSSVDRIPTMRFMRVCLCMFALSIAELKSCWYDGKGLQKRPCFGSYASVWLGEGVCRGVGERGFSSANVFGEVKNKARLYCPPEKLALDGHNYLDILDGEIKAQSSRLTAAELEEQPLGDMLVMGLIKTFPCTGK